MHKPPEYAQIVENCFSNMREIKFRAWDEKDHLMIYPDPFSSSGRWMTWEGNVYRDGKLLDWVMLQYTGLKDKNGKEIYEGDIVRIMYHYDSYGRNETNELRNYQVKWWDKQGSWMMEGAKETFSGATESEVIGNIYENPDLII